MPYSYLETRTRHRPSAESQTSRGSECAVRVRVRCAQAVARRPSRATSAHRCVTAALGLCAACGRTLGGALTYALATTTACNSSLVCTRDAWPQYNGGSLLASSPTASLAPTRGQTRGAPLISHIRPWPRQLRSTQSRHPPRHHPPSTTLWRLRHADASPEPRPDGWQAASMLDAWRARWLAW